jgi:hypothetical protein
MCVKKYFHQPSDLSCAHCTSWTGPILGILVPACLLVLTFVIDRTLVIQLCEYECSTYDSVTEQVYAYSALRCLPFIAYDVLSLA